MVGSDGVELNDDDHVGFVCTGHTPVMISDSILEGRVARAAGLVAFADLSQNVKLILRRKHLMALPGSIGQLKALKELSLPQNKLETVPYSIGQLKALQKLNL